jgi:hypothetical protein
MTVPSRLQSSCSWGCYERVDVLAVFDYKYVNSEGTEFGKLVFLSWCVPSLVQLHKLHIRDMGAAISTQIVCIGGTGWTSLERWLYMKTPSTKHSCAQRNVGVFEPIFDVAVHIKTVAQVFE